jgi:hypothetical protein
MSSLACCTAQFGVPERATRISVTNQHQRIGPLDAPLTRPRNAQRGQRMNHKKAIAEKLGKQS